jgi:uncharacterized protein YcaQ
MARTTREAATETATSDRLRLTLEEARGIQLAAQGLLDVPEPNPDLAALAGVIDRLGVVQVDTINVVRRTQYLVPWSRLGAYDDTLLDALLFPNRTVFEYWSHAASIVPMRDYPYYRADMVCANAFQQNIWVHYQHWKAAHPDPVTRVLDTIRERGPLASADFERDPSAQRASAWDWYGPKESRKALDVLWTLGDLMVHSRRGGQKVYDLRERVLVEAFGEAVPGDDDLPSPEEQLDHFTRRTARALGVVTPSWLWDYFRLGDYDHLSENGKRPARRASAARLLEALAREGALVPAAIEGVSEPAYVAVERMGDLERLRAGEGPQRTTLLSPFDNLIWHRARTRTLFDYEVCFEAYVVPEKRRYGYYCLAVLHRGRLVGRIDPKMDREAKRLIVRAAYLELGVAVDEGLLGGLAGALHDLGRFLGATSITVERSEPEGLAPRLRERVEGAKPKRRKPSARVAPVAARKSSH